MIHPSAIVDPKAEIDGGVEIGPYSIIEKDVLIGEGTRIGPHVVIREGTTIGKRCQIFQFSSIGEAPQAVAYRGEKTSLIVGDDNIMRESVTLHRGTVKGGGKTIIGGLTGVVLDIPPYMLAAGSRAKLFGLNAVGLKRQNFREETIKALKTVYRMIFRSGLTLEEAVH